MALSNLKAGNSNGVDTSVTFSGSPLSNFLSVNGLVKNTSTQVQFTVNLDPTSFTCAWSSDKSEVIIAMTGASRNPTNVIYIVDTGINEKTATPGSAALKIQVIPAGQTTGTVYTFSKSTGGGIRA
ncbi:MAG: hypothetical protein IPL52_16710 [Flavobacteriales bacterium]|nr:hypothetical protein [Flavobacteriales bacterium]